MEQGASSKEMAMMTRRRLLLTTVLAAVMAPLRSAFVRAAEQTKTVDFLFVQTAQGLAFNKSNGTLTLTGVSPVTVFFSDRPERIAGNMKTAHFIPFWSEGKDSFKLNPPNADISLLDGGKLTQVVVELREPKLNGGDLSYSVSVLEGEMPAKASDVSVFIDVIGRPWTPLSYAGVARRAYRRAYFWRR